MTSRTLEAPSTMRAWTHSQPGHPSTVLSLSYDLPIPCLTRPSQVLVRVAFASLNPGASIMTQLAPSFVRTKPCIPELDFAGALVEIGEGASLSRRLSVGMNVFGSVPVPTHMKGTGALAEFVVVDIENVVLVPEGMQVEEAAGLAVAGCTALALLDLAKPRKGMRVLVNAAGGGIGSLLLQMVKEAVGAEGMVVAVCGGDKEELVRSLGADDVSSFCSMIVFC